MRKYYMKKKIRAALRTAVVMLAAGLLASSVTVYAEKKAGNQEKSSIPGEEIAVKMNLEDGEYSVQVDLEGGSGKAGVVSPTILIVRDGRAFTQLQWSSSNYDYMVVDGEKYLPINEEGMNSVFEIPIPAMDEAVQVIADTTAMGTPHEVEYTLVFYADSIGSKGQLPQEAAKRVVAVAVLIIVGGGILNYFVNKRNRC